MQETRDAGSFSGLGRFPGEGNGNPFQYSCLGNPMDSGTWQDPGYRVTKSHRQLKQLSMYTRKIKNIRKKNWPILLLFFENLNIGRKANFWRKVAEFILAILNEVYFKCSEGDFEAFEHAIFLNIMSFPLHTLSKNISKKRPRLYLNPYHISHVMRVFFFFSITKIGALK